MSRGTVPEQPVQWAYGPKMAKHFFNSRILTNFRNRESRILETYVLEYAVVQ